MPRFSPRVRTRGRSPIPDGTGVYAARPTWRQKLPEAALRSRKPVISIVKALHTRWRPSGEAQRDGPCQGEGSILQQSVNETLSNERETPIYSSVLATRVKAGPAARGAWISTACTRRLQGGPTHGTGVRAALTSLPEPCCRSTKRRWPRNMKLTNNDISSAPDVTRIPSKSQSIQCGMEARRP